MFRIPLGIPPPLPPPPSTEHAGKHDVDEHSVERGGGVERGRKREEELVGPERMATDEVEVDKACEEEGGEKDVGGSLRDESGAGADEGKHDLVGREGEMKERFREEINRARRWGIRRTLSKFLVGWRRWRR